MARRWLIVADDLTGAADCAIAFATRGHPATVQWGGVPAEAGEAVLAYDANSRQLDAREAASRHAALLDALHRPGLRVFKKIDSTLRGQPAAELAATLEGLRARDGRILGLLAPAFPATGRTTEGGRVLVNGRPLEEAEVWRRDHSYATAHLPTVLAGSGLRSEVVGLDAVRGGADGLRAALEGAAGRGAEVAVCDAVDEEDLARLAAASLALDPLPVWIGSAGLAHALARATALPAAPPPALARRGGGTLVVVGSLAASSRAAARRLLAEPHLRHVPVAPRVLLESGREAERGACRETVAAALRAGQDVLVEVRMEGEPDMALGPRLAAALGSLLAPVAPHLGGLVATGGETAAALLGRCGVDGLRLVDEIEPGVSLALTLGALTVPIVTKAGAFGDEGTLVRAVRRLRTIQNEGVSS